MMITTLEFRERFEMIFLTQNVKYFIESVFQP